MYQTVGLQFVALERSLNETDRCVMPVRKPREVPQVRLYGVTSGYCRKRAGSDRTNCDIGAGNLLDLKTLAASCSFY